MITIGLVGPSGSGKTTVCNYLKTKGFKRLHFVTPIRQAMAEVFRVNIRYFDASYINEPAAFLGGVTPRMLLEYVGDAIYRAAPDALSLLFQRRFENVAKFKPAGIIADGIRRDIEAAMVRSLGGTIVRVDNGLPGDDALPADVTQRDVIEDHRIFRTATTTKDDSYKQIDFILNLVRS
jgi:adenylate kinase family enzyme